MTEAKARVKAEAEIWEKAENMRMAREIRANLEAETVERARYWYEAKAKEKTEIARVNAEARERTRAEDNARVREKTNAVQMEASETVAKIRAKAEAEIAKR